MFQIDAGDPPRVDSMQFGTTLWGVVTDAADSESPHALASLESLCRTYWFPLYAYVRRRGHSPEDAKDLTQGFFAQLLEKKQLARVDRRKGKFRSWLLGVMNHHLAHEWEKDQAQKRGGGQRLISWDDELADRRYRAEPQAASSPEKAFDRGWALTVLQQARERLRSEYEESGREAVYRELKPFISADEDAISGLEAAARLNMSESGVKTAVHRLRRRYHELVREEIGQTVTHAGEIDEEIRYLLAVMRR